MVLVLASRSSAVAAVTSAVTLFLHTRAHRLVRNYLIKKPRVYIACPPIIVIEVVVTFKVECPRYTALHKLYYSKVIVSLLHGLTEGEMQQVI